MEQIEQFFGNSRSMTRSFVDGVAESQPSCMSCGEPISSGFKGVNLNVQAEDPADLVRYKRHIRELY